MMLKNSLDGAIKKREILKKILTKWKLLLFRIRKLELLFCKHIMRKNGVQNYPRIFRGQFLLENVAGHVSDKNV